MRSQKVLIKFRKQFETFCSKKCPLNSIHFRFMKVDSWAVHLCNFRCYSTTKLLDRPADAVPVTRLLKVWSLRYSIPTSIPVQWMVVAITLIGHSPGILIEQPSREAFSSYNWLVVRRLCLESGSHPGHVTTRRETVYSNSCCEETIRVLVTVFAEIDPPENETLYKCYK